MRFKMIFCYLFPLLSLTGCFEDEGNYDYIDLAEPEFQMGRFPIVFGYDGFNMKKEGKFFFPQADSVELTENAEFEWIINDLVISTEQNLNVPTKEVYEKLKLNKYPGERLKGLFVVKDRRNGIKHMKELDFYIRPKFWRGCYAILSKNNGNSKLSYQRFYKDNDKDGEVIECYENHQDIYAEVNEGKVIPGNPIKLLDYPAKHISPCIGATTILTDKVALDLNNENMKLAFDLKDQFTSGMTGFSYIKDIFYEEGHFSYLIDNNNKIHIRKMSDNFLGGKYLTTPYSIDGNDSKIEWVSEAPAGVKVRYFYDSQNNRMLGLCNHSINLLEKVAVELKIDILDLDEDIKVLASYNKPRFIYDYDHELSLIFYKQGEKYFFYEFFVGYDKKVLLMNENQKNTEVVSEFTDESLFWITSSSPFDCSEAIVYTNKNELRCYSRKTKEDKLIYTFDNEISCMEFDMGDYKYERMAIGFKNGDFKLFNIKYGAFEEIADAAFNVGGEIIDISNVGSKGIR